MSEIFWNKNTKVYNAMLVHLPSGQLFLLVDLNKIVINRAVTQNPK